MKEGEKKEDAEKSEEERTEKKIVWSGTCELSSYLGTEKGIIYEHYCFKV